MMTLVGVDEGLSPARAPRSVDQNGAQTQPDDNRQAPEDRGMLSESWQLQSREERCEHCKDDQAAAGHFESLSEPVPFAASTSRSSAAVLPAEPQTVDPFRELQWGLFFESRLTRKWQILMVHIEDNDLLSVRAAFQANSALLWELAGTDKEASTAGLEESIKAAPDAWARWVRCVEDALQNPHPLEERFGYGVEERSWPGPQDQLTIADALEVVATLAKIYNDISPTEMILYAHYADYRWGDPAAWPDWLDAVAQTLN